MPSQFRCDWLSDFVACTILQLDLLKKPFLVEKKELHRVEVRSEVRSNFFTPKPASFEHIG